jgi:ribosomal protein L34
LACVVCAAGVLPHGSDGWRPKPEFGTYQGNDRTRSRDDSTTNLYRRGSFLARLKTPEGQRSLSLVRIAACGGSQPLIDAPGAM